MSNCHVSKSLGQANDDGINKAFLRFSQFTRFLWYRTRQENTVNITCSLKLLGNLAITMSVFAVKKNKILLRKATYKTFPTRGVPIEGKHLHGRKPHQVIVNLKQHLEINFPSLDASEFHNTLFFSSSNSFIAGYLQEVEAGVEFGLALIYKFIDRYDSPGI